MLENYGKERGDGLPQLEFSNIISNSLDLMRFLVALEEEFDIYIDQEYLLENVLDSTQAVVEMLEKMVD